MKAKYLFEMKVTDPDTKGDVTLEYYKHENGGIFAIDSSFIESELESELLSIIPDPFNKGEVIQIDNDVPFKLLPQTFLPRTKVYVNKGTENECKGFVYLAGVTHCGVRTLDGEDIIVENENLIKA